MYLVLSHFNTLMATDPNVNGGSESLMNKKQQLMLYSFFELVINSRLIFYKPKINTGF